MDVLHILNDGPCEDASFIIDEQSKEHTITVIDLDKDETGYEELVKLIDSCDRVFSW
ncbi:MAG: hypothetical protein OEY52_08880 [Gammaproteobacteria bacterium]|nr:hypothetical protein [Gammaproteobacteria bacterium]